MKIAICEDEKVASDWLFRVVDQWAEKQGYFVEIEQYFSAEQFWFSYEMGRIDILFLDILMPGEDGITLARKIREQKDILPIIFVTGEKDYVFDGYEVQAIHYLLKPVQKEKVEECLNRITATKENLEPYILLTTEQGTIPILQRDIIKVEVFGHDVVYTAVNDTYKTRSTIRECQELLKSEWFVSCYRGILINLWHVNKIEKNQIFLDGSTVPVSRRLYKNINESFIAFYRKR